MYDRAPRVITATTGSTNSEVGPGSYNVKSSKERLSEGFAPFLSLSKRQSCFDDLTQLDVSPGPGRYNLKVPYDGFKGAPTLNSQSERFKEEVSRTPGPGAYAVSKESDWIRNTHPSKKRQTAFNTGEFHSGRVLYKRQPTAPSIPGVGQNYGYEDSGDGGLVPQEKPVHDPTMGPAYYNVQDSSTATTKKYKGCQFSKLKEKRSEFMTKQGPGPGDYDPKLASDMVMSHVKEQKPITDRPESRGKSPALPRYHEVIAKQAEKKAVPGPGKYVIKSQFSREQSKELFGSHSLPFGSTSKRFSSASTAAPAPGSYDDPRTAFEGSKRASGITRSPFGQTSTRFKEDKNIKRLPGPGAYNDNTVTSLAANLNREALLDYLGVKAAFGSTSVRTQSLVKRDELNKPGPAHYSPSDRQQTLMYQKPMASFASTSRRLYEPPPIVTSIPPPGSYEVADSYHVTQDKKDIKSATNGHKVAFSSTSTRSQKPADMLLEEPDRHNPGPGEYQIEQGLVKPGKQGEISSREHRFKTPNNTVPGPGAYSLSVSMKNTLLKGTFNSSLHNPLSDESAKKDSNLPSKGTHSFDLSV